MVNRQLRQRRAQSSQCFTETRTREPLRRLTQCTDTLFLSLTLTRTHTHIHPQTLSLSLSLFLPLSFMHNFLSLSHTHTHTHFLSVSFSLPLSHTPSLSQGVVLEAEGAISNSGVSGGLRLRRLGPVLEHQWWRSGRRIQCVGHTAPHSLSLEERSSFCDSHACE